MAVVKLICSKCGKEKPEVNFFKLKSGERHSMCKDCLLQHVVNTDPNTFMWILELFDVPYIERTWIELSNKIRMKNPEKFGSKSVMGHYLRMMNMNQYSSYCFADTEKLNLEEEERRKRANLKREKNAELNQTNEEDLKKKYEEGEISEAEYDTMRVDPNMFNFAPEEAPHHIVTGEDLKEQEIASKLNEEDFQYLTLKWGTMYKPSEWVKMEELYTKYASEYELNVDRENTLKKICKTSLKMDQALDIGDVVSFKNLSAVYDQLRKSGKFTEAQNKEDQEQFLDSVGEMVALVEREGGIIDEMSYQADFPQDKVDLTLKDMKSYTYNLVKNEMGLGDLIESYVQKLEQQMEEEKTKTSLADGLVTNEEEEHLQDLTDDEAYAFQEYLDNEIEKDANLLLQQVEGDEFGT